MVTTQRNNEKYDVEAPQPQMNTETSSGTNCDASCKQTSQSIASCQRDAILGALKYPAYFLLGFILLGTVFAFGTLPKSSEATQPDPTPITLEETLEWNDRFIGNIVLALITCAVIVPTLRYCFFFDMYQKFYYHLKKYRHHTDLYNSQRSRENEYQVWAMKFVMFGSVMLLIFTTVLTISLGIHPYTMLSFFVFGFLSVVCARVALILHRYGILMMILAMTMHLSMVSATETVVTMQQSSPEYYTAQQRQLMCGFAQILNVTDSVKLRKQYRYTDSLYWTKDLAENAAHYMNGCFGVNPFTPNCELANKIEYIESSKIAQLMKEFRVMPQLLHLTRQNAQLAADYKTVCQNKIRAKQRKRPKKRTHVQGKKLQNYKFDDRCAIKTCERIMHDRYDRREFNGELPPNPPNRAVFRSSDLWPKFYAALRWFVPYESKFTQSSRDYIEKKAPPICHGLISFFEDLDEMFYLGVSNYYYTPMEHADGWIIGKHETRFEDADWKLPEGMCAKMRTFEHLCRPLIDEEFEWIDLFPHYVTDDIDSLNNIHRFGQNTLITYGEVLELTGRMLIRSIGKQSGFGIERSYQEDYERLTRLWTMYGALGLTGPVTCDEFAMSVLWHVFLWRNPQKLEDFGGLVENDHCASDICKAWSMKMKPASLKSKCLQKIFVCKTCLDETRANKQKKVAKCTHFFEDGTADTNTFLRGQYLTPIDISRGVAGKYLGATVMNWSINSSTNQEGFTEIKRAANNAFDSVKGKIHELLVMDIGENSQIAIAGTILSVAILVAALCGKRKIALAGAAFVVAGILIHFGYVKEIGKFVCQVHETLQTKTDWTIGFIAVILAALLGGSAIGMTRSIFTTEHGGTNWNALLNSLRTGVWAVPLLFALVHSQLTKASSLCGFPVTESKFNSYLKDISDEYIEINKIRDLEMELNRDVTLCDRVDQLFFKWLDFDQVLTKTRQRLSEGTKTALTDIRIGMMKLKKAADMSSSRSAHKKKAPYCIEFTGESQIGKSTLMPFIQMHLLDHVHPDLPTTELVSHPQKYVYSRDSTSEFWDGYSGQKIIVMDDWSARKDGANVPNEGMYDLIRMVNRAPHILNMARVEFKGIVHNKAELVILTSNISTPEVLSLTYADAVYNRRHKLIHVSVRKEFTDVSGKKLDSDKAVSAIERGAKPTDLHTFTFLNPITGNSLGRSTEHMDYAEMIQRVDAGFEKHLKGQAGVSNAVLAEAIRIDKQKGRNDPSQDDIVKACLLKAAGKNIRIPKAGEFSGTSSTVDDEDTESPEAYRLAHPVDPNEIRTGQPTKKQGVDFLDLACGEKTSSPRRVHYTDTEPKIPIPDPPVYPEQPILADHSKGWTIKKDPISGLQYIVRDDEDPDFKGTPFGSKYHPADVSQKALEEQLGFGSDIRQTDEESKIANVLGGTGEILTSIAPCARNEIGHSKFRALSEHYWDWKGPSRKKHHTLTMMAIGVAAVGLCISLGSWFFGGENVDTQGKAIVSVPLKERASKLKIQGESLMVEEVDENKGKPIWTPKLVDCNAIGVTSNDLDIVNRIHDNMFVLRGHKGYITGTFIKGHTAMISSHMLTKFMNEHAGMQIEVCRFNTVGKCETEDLKVVPLEHKPDISFLVFPKTVAASSDISRYLMKSEDRAEYHQTPAVLLSTSSRTTGLKYHTRFAQSAMAVGKLSSPDTINMDNWKYDMVTMDGDCGSPLVLLGTRNMLPRIGGIHWASNSGYGYSHFVTYEDLVGKVQFLNVQGSPNHELPVATRTVTGTLDFATVPEVNPVYSRTSLQETRLKQRLKVDVAPALLAPNEQVDPYKVALKKNEIEYKYLQRPILKMAVNDVVNHLTKTFAGKNIATPLTMDQSIVGLDEDHADKVNTKSGPGYPFKYEKPGQGKKPWANIDDDGNCTIDPKFQQQVEDVIADAKQGIRRLHVYEDTLKDELRPMQKVIDGKTRLFSAAPFDLVVATRTFFLKFNKIIMDNNLETGITMGINPYSSDWDLIAEKVKRYNRILCGDYERFDVSLGPQILDATMEVINQLCALDPNDTPENKLARETLFYEVMHPIHHAGQHLYQQLGGMPSGNPLTAVGDSIANLIIINYVHRTQVGSRGFPFYHRGFAFVNGDDNLILHMDDDVLMGIRNNMGRAGVSYLNTDKSGPADVVGTGGFGIYQSNPPISFLKRKFVDRDGYWVAPLDMDSIYKSLAYHHKQIPEATHVKEVWENSAIKELAQHNPKTALQAGKIIYDGIIGEYPGMDIAPLPTVQSLENLAIFSKTKVQGKGDDGVVPGQDVSVETFEQNPTQERVGEPLEKVNITTKKQQDKNVLNDGLRLDFQQVLGRPTALGNFSIGSSESAGKTQTTYNLPHDLIAVETFADKLNGYKGFDFVAVLRFEVASDYHTSGLLRFWVQLHPFQAPIFDTSSINYASSMPGEDLNLANDKSVEIRVPFSSPEPYFDLTKNQDPFAMVNCTVISPISGGGTSVKADIRVFGYFEKVDLQFPTNQDLASVTKGLSKDLDPEIAADSRMRDIMTEARALKGEEKLEVLAKLETRTQGPPRQFESDDEINAGHIESKMNGRNQMAPTFAEKLSGMATATMNGSRILHSAEASAGVLGRIGGWLWKGIKGAWSVGSSVLGALSLFGLAKPLSMAAVQPTTSSRFRGIGNSDGVVTAGNLGGDMDTQVPANATMKEDEMSIKYLTSKWTTFTSFAYDTGDAVTTALWKWNNSPFMPLTGEETTEYEGEDATDGSTVQYWISSSFITSTFLGYIANAFHFWTGTIVYKFRIIKAPIMKGKLRITFSPGQLKTSGTAPSARVIEKIWDIGATDEIEFPVPYAHTKHFLRVYRPPIYTGADATSKDKYCYMDPDGSTASLDECNGCLRVEVVNPLKGDSVTSGKANIVVSVRGGEDFCLAAPRDPLYCPTTGVKTLPTMATDEFYIGRLEKASLVSAKKREELEKRMTELDEELKLAHRQGFESHVTGEEYSLKCFGEVYHSIKQLLVRSQLLGYATGSSFRMAAEPHVKYVDLNEFMNAPNWIVQRQSPTFFDYFAPLYTYYSGGQIFGIVVDSDVGVMRANRAIYRFTDINDIGSWVPFAKSSAPTGGRFGIEDTLQPETLGCGEPLVYEHSKDGGMMVKVPYARPTPFSILTRFQRDGNWILGTYDTNEVSKLTPAFTIGFDREVKVAITRAMADDFVMSQVRSPLQTTNNAIPNKQAVTQSPQIKGVTSVYQLDPDAKQSTRNDGTRQRILLDLGVSDYSEFAAGKRF